jgi:hypothetical protein
MSAARDAINRAHTMTKGKGDDAETIRRSDRQRLRVGGALEFWYAGQ